MKRLPLSRLVLTAVALLALVGCAAPLEPARFAGATPTFDPVAFFTGPTRSWGVFENRAGRPTRRFTTACVGRRQADGTLLLDQTFSYDDGATQRRHWRIRRLDAHRYEATADDVVGPASGEAYGNAFRWEYTVALRPGNPLGNVRLRQWMYLQPDGRTMLNRGSVHVRGGLTVAQVAEEFRRE